MNAAHWHLLLNHIPVIGTIVGLLVLGTGFMVNNTTVKRTALGIFVFAALFAIPAYLTGEGSEEVVEKLPGVTENGIEEHEDLGGVLLAIESVLGVLALLAFYVDLKNRKAASLLYGLVFLFALGATGISKFVATSGGEIRHTEIRSGATQPAAGEPSTGEQEDKD